MDMLTIQTRHAISNCLKLSGLQESEIKISAAASISKKVSTTTWIYRQTNSCKFRFQKTSRVVLELIIVFIREVHIIVSICINSSGLQGRVPYITSKSNL